MRHRPEHWRPVGPLPEGPGSNPDLVPGAGETLDCLSGHWKIFQLRNGHRYSTDDLLTAWFAARSMARGPAPRAHLDLGCGIGSVGLLLLWRFPDLLSVGVEAQQRSASLARRSARYNGVARRFVVLSGDFRTPLDPGFREPFDWVTGSPPYLTGSEGRRSLHPQRGPCRFEDRGGIDAYLHAAATYARPGAGVTWVHASRYTELSLAAADAHGLGEVRCRPVIFREGRESLISLFEARVGSPWSLLRERPLLVRDTAGEWSEEFRSVREEMGFPV